MKRDTWLYGNSSPRTVRKAAKGQFASDATHLYLVEGPEERRARVNITDWGGAKGDQVTVVKAEQREPPPSRQLRDPFTTFYVQGIALEPPLPPDRLLNLTEENPLHSACLQAKATDACGRGWEFAPKEGKKSSQGLLHSDVPEKLRGVLEDLTPELTFTELLYQAAWEMDGIGWAAWEGVRDEQAVPGKHGGVGAIYPIPSHTIRASLDPRKWIQIRAGRVRYFKKWGAKCTVNNETGEILDWKDSGDLKRAQDMPPELVASELIIFRNYTPRSLWYGVPRWVSSIATIAELAAIREFNVSWFASGGQVDYSMHFKSNSRDEAGKLKEQVEQQVRENAGRGHTKLFTYGDKDTDVAVNKLGDTLREGHFRFRRGDLIKEVLIAHAVPPYRIGWAEQGSLGGSSAHEMLGAYKFGAIDPIQVVFKDRLRASLFDPETGIDTGEFRFELQEFEFEDQKDELQYALGTVLNGLATPNQGREQLGMDPDQENKELLDKYYFRGLPLGQAPAAPGGGPNAGAPPGKPFGKPGEKPGESGKPGQPPKGEGAQGPGGPTTGTGAALGGSAGVPVVTSEEGVDPAVWAAKQAIVEMLAGYETQLREMFRASKVAGGDQWMDEPRGDGGKWTSGGGGGGRAGMAGFGPGWGAATTRSDVTPISAATSPPPAFVRDRMSEDVQVASVHVTHTVMSRVTHFIHAVGHHTEEFIREHVEVHVFESLNIASMGSMDTPAGSLGAGARYMSKGKDAGPVVLFMDGTEKGWLAVSSKYPRKQFDAAMQGVLKSLERRLDGHAGPLPGIIDVKAKKRASRRLPVEPTLAGPARDDKPNIAGK